MKIDPYLNVDAGTMNPTEHGEVFVMNSGLETDQDMGNYERFLNRDLSEEDYLTSGMVYKHVIDKERTFGYKGKCVESMIQVIDEIRNRIETSAKKSKSDVQVIEIGGTLGDYQNFLFLETARQMNVDYPDDVITALVSYLPVPSTIGEMKTRPTQNAIRMLNSYGIQPSIVIARSSEEIDKKRREKIARACNLSEKNIIPAPDSENIYDVPLFFEDSNIIKIITKDLNLRSRKKTGMLSKWKKFNNTIKNGKKGEVRIGIVGKYFETGSYVLSDAYLSIIEAIKFSAVSNDVSTKIEWLSSSKFEGKQQAKHLKNLDSFDAIIVPGGFGSRGVEGKINVLKYARTKNIPVLGICYGMQLMVVEFMRNVVKKRKANTIEIDPKTPHPVITFIEGMREKVTEKRYGGTMRLGSYVANIKPNTLLSKLYKEKKLTERHRHRYEVNGDYIPSFEEHGLTVSAYSKEGLAEVVEISDHPFYIGTQFHPEFTARPFYPNPIFNGLIKAAIVKAGIGKKKK